MFEDIYVLYILFKYKIGTISRVELFKEFREYVKSKGQIFIKLLQNFLTSQYVFGKDFTLDEIETLNQILDNVYYQVENADFEVGSGSVAYVHYKQDDKSRVIKRKLPNIVDTINKSSTNFKNMIYYAKISINLNIDDSSIDEYKKLLLKQTNLVKEAENTIRMGKILNLEHIKVPKVYNYNNEMIEMEYVKGIKLSEFIKKYPKRKEVCSSLIVLLMRKMIDNNFVHGDLHEGNLLFSIDENNLVNLNLIDFGIVFEIDNYQKEIFLNYLLFGRDKTLFFYLMSTKETSFEVFDEYFKKHEGNNSYQMFEEMRENNVKFNFYYTTFLMGLNNLKVKSNKLKN